jgi:pyruvate/2-oxoglutarate dehydrogenase complex dihydrolipoamide dehydrogenase (E3) component
MPTEAEATHDVVVIGAGSTGENVADYAHQGGLSVALVEQALVGGDCSYWACMPSKALLRPPEALAATWAVDGARQAVQGQLDVPAVLGRRDSFTSHWDDRGQADWVEGIGVELVRGEGRLAGERQVEVESEDGSRRRLVARVAVAVCTGSEPAMPPVPGLAEARYWTTKDATSAKAAPRRLAILGGGVAGCEMATAWSALGASEVSIVEQEPTLLPGYEAESGRRLGQALEDRGVRVCTGARVERVSSEGGEEPVTLAMAGGAELEADQLLVATGRRARTARLGLESVGLEPGAWLEVDDTCLVTGVPGLWLYAAGDVNHRALLTHMGKYQARICGDAIAARARGEEVSPAPWSPYAATADHRAIPQVVFSDPEVAAVGLTEAQARDRGLAVACVEYEMGRVAGAALYADDYSGWAKLTIDSGRDVVVGATFVGPGVAELVHAATVAVVGEVPLHRLWHAVPAYPTISEVWLRLLEAWRRSGGGR